MNVNLYTNKCWKLLKITDGVFFFSHSSFIIGSTMTAGILQTQSRVNLKCVTLDLINLESQLKKIISIIFLIYCLNVIVFVSVLSFIEINSFSIVSCKLVWQTSHLKRESYHSVEGKEIGLFRCWESYTKNKTKDWKL